MDNLIVDVVDFAVAYLDDVAIYSKMWNYHSEQMNSILGIIQNACLTIKA